MDSILISTHPKHCWNIFRRIKTVEVRKSIPKNGAPFKVHIYCTSIKSMNLRDYCEIHKSTGGIVDDWSGKVIGEFICDKIEQLSEKDLFFGMDEIRNSTIEDFSCVPIDELLRYKGEKQYLYGLHISELKIYDKPKELSDFTVQSKSGCVNEGKCRSCIYFDKGNGFNVEDDCKAPFCTDEYKPLRRPPQSWCYVRELKGE